MFTSKSVLVDKRKFVTMEVDDEIMVSKDGTVKLSVIRRMHEISEQINHTKR